MRIKVFILALLIALLPSCGAAKVVEYKVKVVKEYPHDVTSYTQGLFFHDGRFYESTGQWGSSTLRIVDLESGKPVKKVSFNNKYFIEGSVVFGGDLYVLTWTNKVAFKYNPETLEYKSTQGYPREGWGMTTDGKQIITSDGSSQLWIDGKIWANVYTTDLIVVIDPKSGEVVSTVDCTGLLPAKLRTQDTDVLNGIAYKDGHIYLTGKNWPRLYEVELIKK